MAQLSAEQERVRAVLIDSARRRTLQPINMTPEVRLGVGEVESYPVGGEQLRDRFAGQALAGLLANPTDPGDYSIETLAARMADLSYLYADAMIARRQG